MAPPVVALVMALALALLQGEAPAPKPLPDLPDWVFAVSPEDENLDVLYFGEAGPTFLRFRVRINGRGYRSNWDGFLARLYKFADADDDGILTEAEARRPGWSQLLANPNGGFFEFGASSPAPGGRTDGPRAEGRAGLAGGLLEVRPRRPRAKVPAGGPGSSSRTNNPVDQSTFNQLDENRDGALSTAELASAEGLIRRLDVDEDEMLDQGELDPNRNPFAGVFFGDGAPRRGRPARQSLRRPGGFAEARTRCGSTAPGPIRRDRRIDPG